MATIFVPLSNNDVFAGAVGPSASLVHCSLTDGIDGNNFSILTNVSISGTETLQFFQSFDDLIHYFYFGKGLGQIRFDIMCFFDCNGNAPGIKEVWQQIGSARGQIISVDIGPMHVEGVLMDFSISLGAEPVPIYTVSINLGMTDHDLPKPNIPSSC